MANWCFNRVEFTGSEFALTGIKLLFHELAEKGQAEQKGQLPEFIKDDEGYFFDIQCEDEVIYYETRWSPNTDILKKIADEYAVGFVHSYDESGNCIFGEAIYKDGELKDLSLDFKDYDLYEFDEATDLYHFEGNAYESDEEILETLLERKKGL